MTHAKRPRGLTPERQMLEFIVCLIVTVLLFRTWHVDNFVVPSGSMATTLLGVHRSVRCADCGYAFACGSGEVDGFPDQDARATCPNCGSIDNPLGTLADAAGDRLLVSKQAFGIRSPRRWEVAVFRRSDIGDKVFVKRIAGLPGESIQIRDGDVYVDGEIQRKSLAQQRAMAIVVHDSRFASRSLGNRADRWQGDERGSLWRRESEGYFHPAEAGPRTSSVPDEPGVAAVDWLTYRHMQPRYGSDHAPAETPIEDDYGYNQTRPIEEVADISDLMLACRLRAFGRGELLLFASDGREHFVLQIDVQGGLVTLDHNGRRVAAATRQIALGKRLFEYPARVELSLVDRQLLLAIDGDGIASYPYSPSKLPRTPTSRPLAIGSRGLGLDVSDVRVLRDIYYTHPRGVYGRWALDRPYQLRQDEYFVLGDNSPLSEDSRYWPEGPGVRASLLIGKPLVVHLPSRLADWGWGPFNVPDLSAIRYIR